MKFVHSMVIYFLFLFCLFVLSNRNIANAQYSGAYSPMREYTGQEICDILDIPENNIDIGLWALIIAKEYVMPQ